MLVCARNSLHAHHACELGQLSQGCLSHVGALQCLPVRGVHRGTCCCTMHCSITHGNQLKLLWFPSSFIKHAYRLAAARSPYLCMHTSCSHDVITARCCSRCRFVCSTRSCRCRAAAPRHDATARRCEARRPCWLACAFRALQAAAAAVASLKCLRMRRQSEAFARASAAAWRACCAP